MKHTLAALMIAVPALVLSSGAMSAAGVIEAQPFTPGQTPTGGQPGSASSNDALVMLLDQFREMRSELETLRGMVEEQNYELRNLQRESMDRYSDLDSRVSALSLATPPLTSPSTLTPTVSAPNAVLNAGVTPVVPAPVAPVPPSAQDVAMPQSTVAETRFPVATNSIPSVAPAPATNTAVTTANTALSAQAPLQPTVLSEQQQYQMALDSLLQEEEYQRSADEFNQYLSLYPSGRFVTNAYYWKGQAYINLSQLDQAREAFETIVNQYPEGRKVDDAMYSLGTVYDKLGNADRARQLLRQVQSRYPNTSAANLADIYLRSMN